MAGLGVIGSIFSCPCKSFSRRDLGQQLRQRQCVADAVIIDLNAADFQGFRIKTQMHLKPLATVFSAMLLRFHLPSHSIFKPVLSSTKCRLPRRGRYEVYVYNVFW